MRNTTFSDWEKIKSIIKDYETNQNPKKEDIAKGFIESYDQHHLELPKNFGSWIELYTKIIKEILNVYPKIDFSNVLDDDGNYISIEHLSY